VTTLPMPGGDLSPEMKRELRDIEVEVLIQAVRSISKWISSEIEENAQVLEYQHIESQWSTVLAVLCMGDWYGAGAGGPPAWLDMNPARDPAATPHEAWCNFVMQAVREVTRQVANIARFQENVIAMIVSLEESYEDLLYQVMVRRGEPS
jgi:hypothetical protein